MKITQGKKEKGYVLIKFKKVVNISNDAAFTVAWTAEGNGSSTYNGQEVSLVSLKEKLSVQYNEEDFTDYSLSVQGDEKIKDAGDYTIVVTPNQEGLRGFKNITYTVNPAKLTVTIKEQTIELPGKQVVTDLTEGTTYSITGEVGEETVTLTGNITYNETTAKTPGVHEDALTGNNNIKLAEDNDVNKNYEIETVNAGDLTVKYNLTGENWKQVLEVKVDGTGTYTYDGEAHGATVTGKDNIDLSQYIDVIYRLKIDNDKTQEIEGEPTDAGDYEIVVKIKEQYKDYFDAGEVGLATVGEIKINPAAITITGSMTVTEGATLEESYGLDDITISTLTGIAEGQESNVKAAITITPTVVDDELTAETTYTNAFKIVLNESVINYTIDEENSSISLVVTEDENAWATTGEAKATVTVYVDQKGKIVKAEPECTISEGSLTISLADVDLSGWKYTPTYDGSQTADPIIKGDEISSFSMMINYYGNLFITALEPYTSQLPASIKVKIENEETAGYLAINFTEVKTITEENITKGGEGNLEEGELLYGDGKHVIYDGEPHGLDALVLNIDGTETEPISAGYSVSYKGEGLDAEGYPVDAGEYTATVEFYPTSGYTGTVNLEITIAPRPLTLTFEFERIEEGETLYYTGIDTDDLVPGEQISDNNIDVTFKTSEPDANGYCDVYIENIAFHADGNFNPDNYDIYVQAGTVQIHLTHAEDSDTYTPAEDEGNGDFNNPVGDVEVVDQSGQSSSGITYKRYELKLANKDFYPVNCREDYAAEGIELLSRHDKKTTWEGGSFTVYYKHNGVENDGEYRVFIRRGDHGDKWEEITQDITGYYQIRNVTSNIYVKLYYGTGFPVANEEITATDARAYSQANKIVVITPEPTDVQIISMTGAVVATDQVTGQREFANLMEGVYIVRMGDTVVKLQVRN